MRNLIAILMVLALLTGAACAETLRVGMECNYAPFNWTQADESENAVEKAEKDALLLIF